jgi:hypothetical protein
MQSDRLLRFNGQKRLASAYCGGSPIAANSARVWLTHGRSMGRTHLAECSMNRRPAQNRVPLSSQPCAGLH